MPAENEFTLDHERHGRNGSFRLTARFCDGTSHTDKIDVAVAKDRERFARALVKGHRGLNKNIVTAELEKIAADVLAKPTEIDEPNGKFEQKRPSQADILVTLAMDAEFFHTPGGHDSEGYATVTINEHTETWPIQGKGFKRWLGKLFYDHCEKAANSKALQDAVNVLAGKAVHEGAEKEIAVRLAQTTDGIWLDLADEQWRAVRITSTGWQIVTDTPVKFVRKRGMFALPVPLQGGNINMLRELVNLPDNDTWILFVAWLVAALRPGRPFPILAVNGEQGSAKSTLCKMARALIDPNIAPLRRPPREDRDLMIAATNGLIVAFDNLSGLSASLSDALCMLATGGGFGARELFSDDDEKLFDATRPVIVNGIEELATRSDLLDRALTLTLPEISGYRDEEELWLRFNQLRPAILGGFLDAVVVALRNRPMVKLLEKPRMADFACWIVAAEPSLGWPAGDFMAAYNRNRGAANSLALDSSIIGPPIMALADSIGSWQGTAKELLAELETKYTDEKTRGRKEWPTSSRKLSGELRRLAPNLRRSGIQVNFGKHTKKGTPITLDQTRKTSSPSSLSSPENPQQASSGDHGTPKPLSPEPQSSPPKPFSRQEIDKGDEGDDVFRPKANSLFPADEW